MSELVDMCCRSKVLTCSFELNIDKWSTISPDVKTTVSSGWQNIKFLNDAGTDLNKDITWVTSVHPVHWTSTAQKRFQSSQKMSKLFKGYTPFNCSNEGIMGERIVFFLIDTW